MAGMKKLTLEEFTLNARNNAKYSNYKPDIVLRAATISFHNLSKYSN